MDVLKGAVDISPDSVAAVAESIRFFAPCYVSPMVNPNHQPCGKCSVCRAEVMLNAQSGLLNAPELLDFREAVVLEAAHQRVRWGVDPDAGKEPMDWFWLVGYLTGKALAAQLAGSREKALHHTISTAAALANWHAHILLGTSAMRPGISAEKQAAAESEER